MLTILTYNTAAPATAPADRDPGILTLAFAALAALRRGIVRFRQPRFRALPTVPFAWL